MRSLLRNSAKSLALISVLLLAACGGGGSGGPAVSKKESPEKNYLLVTDDDYGLQRPNFYYSTENAAFWSIQAGIGKNVWDTDFRCVIRIDIPRSPAGAFPELDGRTFSFGAAAGRDPFPGSFFVFNGHPSTGKQVEAGTISFAPGSSAGGSVEGDFEVTLVDGDSNLVPVPRYHLKGSFGFRTGTSGPSEPLPAEVFPKAGLDAYNRFCSQCHTLGAFDMAGNADLSRRGGELPLVYPGSGASHAGILIEPSVMQDLRVFLNAH